MVGFNRDEVPGLPVASNDSDPCSFYTTKLWMFIHEMLRWWSTWKDVVIERDRKKLQIPELEAQVKALQAEVDALKARGAGAGQLTEKQKELRRGRGISRRPDASWPSSTIGFAITTTRGRRLTRT